MATFKLTFNTDNAAFQENMSDEIARALGGVIAKVQNGNNTSGVVRDSNGNNVGSWSLEETTS